MKRAWAKTHRSAAYEVHTVEIPMATRGGVRRSGKVSPSVKDARDRSFARRKYAYSPGDPPNLTTSATKDAETKKDNGAASPAKTKSRHVAWGGGGGLQVGGSDESTTTRSSSSSSSSSSRGRVAASTKKNDGFRRTKKSSGGSSNINRSGGCRGDNRSNNNCSAFRRVQGRGRPSNSIVSHRSMTFCYCTIL